MTNFKISQEEKNRILEMHSSKKIISEQKQFLAKLFGGSVDDIFKMFSDDAVKSMDDVFAKVFTKPINLVQKGSQQFLKSASGAEVPMKTVQDAIQLVAQGKLKASEIATYLPRQLADGSEFRSIIVSNLEKRGAQKVGGQVGTNLSGKVLGQFEAKNLLSRCISHVACDTKPILDAFYRKLSGSARLTKFDPTKVKVLEKTNVSGREVINVALEDGTNVLFYKSSGANVATTGKQAGEWFVIPGFAENGWFFKTKETIELTKGGNKYLTDMANYLQQNGVSKLGLK